MFTGKQYIALKIAAFCAFSLASCGAIAASGSMTFDLPATGIPSLHPVYPDVATLTFADIAGGVQFVLTPNSSSSGVKNDPAKSFVQELQFVYSGSLSGSLVFTDVYGAAVQSVKIGKTAKMDSGYTSKSDYIDVNFFNNAPAKKESKDSRFNFTQTSTWDISGITVSQLGNTYATAKNKPSPIDGIISVAPYALKGCLTPTTSNWVSAVPEPDTSSLIITGLGLLGFMVLRKNNS